MQTAILRFLIPDDSFHLNQMYLDRPFNINDVCIMISDPSSNPRDIFDIIRCWAEQAWNMLNTSHVILSMWHGIVVASCTYSTVILEQTKYPVGNSSMFGPFLLILPHKTNHPNNQQATTNYSTHTKCNKKWSRFPLSSGKKNTARPSKDDNKNCAWQNDSLFHMRFSQRHFMMIVWGISKSDQNLLIDDMDLTV
jgi:hypothetical protein